jgi:hypothetical protein
MAATGIQKMKHPHDAVMDYLLANPFWTLDQLSKATGYTVPWLSQMINSDCFQDEYARRRGPAEACVFQSIQQRLQGLSHLAIDKLETQLSKTNDPDFIIDAFDKVLHRTGYAPKAQAIAPPVLQQQNNLFVVDRQELADLRGVILEGQALPSPMQAESSEQKEGDE